jgi:hypothetical protein
LGNVNLGENVDVTQITQTQTTTECNGLLCLRETVTITQTDDTARKGVATTLNAPDTVLTAGPNKTVTVGPHDGTRLQVLKDKGQKSVVV